MAQKHSKRVNVDDLDYVDHCVQFNGQPFTGISEERWPDGRLESEVRYVDGFERGLARYWYPNGALEAEYFYAEPSEISTFREWHENGHPRLERLNRMGRSISTRRWKENGELIETSSTTPDSKDESQEKTEAKKNGQ